MSDMKERIKDSGTGKVAKDSEEANYFGPERGPFKCARCEYFIKPNACEKVKGKIDPNGCCNLFDDE